MIVFSVSDIEHADQIGAGGVTVTGTVMSDQQDYSRNAAYPCTGATVSYTTASGTPEQAGLVQDGDCLPAGSTVQVVYDPKAPNVIQPAGNRGSTAGGWSGVIMGSLCTILVWGAFIWGLLSRKRRGVRGPRKVAVQTLSGLGSFALPGLPRGASEILRHVADWDRDVRPDYYRQARRLLDNPS
jgi:hypothetical protein